MRSGAGHAATGEYTYGYCDRCDFRYPLKDLKTEVVHGVTNNLRICPECWNPDHPQLFLHEVRVDDPRPVWDPRPDKGLADSRRLFAWDPVGSNIPTLRLGLGKVTVETS